MQEVLQVVFNCVEMHRWRIEFIRGEEAQRGPITRSYHIGCLQRQILGWPWLFHLKEAIRLRWQPFILKQSRWKLSAEERIRVRSFIYMVRGRSKMHLRDSTHLKSQKRLRIRHGQTYKRFRQVRAEPKRIFEERCKSLAKSKRIERVLLGQGRAWWGQSWTSFWE